MKIPVSYGPPRNKRTVAYSLLASTMLVLMLTAQLYGYEDFAFILPGITSINNATTLAILAGCIVLVELFALPYLLGTYLSKLMRVISAVLAFGISGFWLFAALTNAHAQNVGLFSSTLELHGGILPAIWSLVLFSLVCKVMYVDSRFRHATS